MRHEKYTGFNLPTVMAVGVLCSMGGAIASSSLETAKDPSKKERIDILPDCENARGQNEALIPVQYEAVSEAIGMTAVCKVNEETFSIVSRDRE